MKLPIFIALFLITSLTKAQNVGIGTTTPTQKLDVIGNVRSSTLSGVGNRSVIADPTGTLIIGTTANAADWTLFGNAGTNPTNNFIGTTDAVDFVIKSGGIAPANERLRVLSTGPVVINNIGLGVNGVGDVFSVYASGTTNGTNAATSLLGAFAINGYSASNGIGVYGENAGTGSGIYGNTSAGLGAVGVSVSGTGLYGQSNGNLTFGGRIANINASGTGLVVTGNNTAGTFLANGSGISCRGNLLGGLFLSNTNTAALNGGAVVGVNGKVNIVTYAGGAGVIGIDSTSGSGVIGKTFGIGLDGVYGESGPDGNGITGIGIVGAAGIPYGVYGDAGSGNSSIGVVGNVASGGATRYGGFFFNDLGSTGTKPFMIDHPLAPAEKYLKHFSIESNEVLNLYRGIVTLDANGEAIVTLPSYFESINNSNATYQLTGIGQPSVVYIKEELNGNSFTIAGGAPGKKVSWQLTTERNDPYLQQFPEERMVEINKTGNDYGKYLVPELYQQPANRGISFKEKIHSRILSGAVVQAPILSTTNLVTKTPAGILPREK
jgi:hypothetical protein